MHTKFTFLFFNFYVKFFYFTFSIGYRYIKNYTFFYHNFDVTDYE